MAVVDAQTYAAVVDAYATRSKLALGAKAERSGGRKSTRLRFASPHQLSPMLISTAFLKCKILTKDRCLLEMRVQFFDE